MVEDRIAALEVRTATLETRLRILEGAPPRTAPTYQPPAAAAGELSRYPELPRVHVPEPLPRVLAPPHAFAPPRVSTQPKRDLEDILGGSVLAWLGGFAVLAGLAFLLTIAVSRGWIGEGARTALAGVFSLGLLGAGVWLRERRGQTEAALAASAVGIAGMFGTLVVAGPVYELIPIPLALAAALATGAGATVLATRWRAQVMGWLGLLGALCAPIALGALDGGGITFLAIAFAATIAVIVWQRWSTLAIFAVLTAGLQWVGWLFADTPSDGAVTLTLVVFGGLTAALALGLEANRRGLHPVEIGPRAKVLTDGVAVALLLAGAATLAATGWSLLDGEPWLVALAVAHLALGLAATRVTRISREFALIVLAVGVVLANIAFASIATGLPLMLGWAVSALPFAALLGGSPLVDRVLGKPDGEQAARADRILGLAGLIAQMALAAGQALGFDAHPQELAGPAASLPALVAAGAFALLAAACAQLAGPALRTALNTVAFAAVAYLTGLALEGAALSAVLAAESLALAELARRRHDAIAAWAAVAFAGAGLLHALAVLAPPEALLNGLDAPLAAAAALLAVALAFAVAGRTLSGDARRALTAAAALTLLYLASVEIVTAAGPERTGQTLVSVLWAIAGVGALVRGLLADDRPLRRAALVLIAVAAAKVFLYDLASLDSLSRVGSLMGFGLLLLVGSFAWQRVRPRGAEVG